MRLKPLPVRASCHVRVSLLAGFVAVAAAGGDLRAQASATATTSDGGSSPRPESDARTDLEQLLGIEVQSVFGASRFLQKSTEAPAAVTVVTADEIWRYGWRTLADVLRSVRGFYVTDDRSWAYVGLRGFQRTGDYNTRILLLLDGRRTNDNIYDQALVQEDWLVDLSDVERIEIIRGPSSSLYGSNAFSGVINVVTRGAAPDRPATVSTDLGTLGLRTQRASIGGQLGQSLAVRLSASLQRRDGVSRFYTPEFDDGTPGAGVAHDLDYTNRENVFVQAKYLRVNLSGGYNRRKRGLPTGAYDVVRNHRDTWVTDRHAFAEARTQGTWRRWDTEVRGGYDNYEYVGSYPYVADDDPSRVAANMDVGRGQWLTGGVQLSRRVTGGQHLTLGVERRQHLEERQLNYFIDQSPLLDVRRRSNTTGVYLQEEWRLHPTFLLNAGVRYDRYLAFSDPVKPRAAAIYQPDRRTTLKLIYGEAFRAPTVYETDYAFPGTYLSNPALTPEETRRVEALVEHYVGSRARLTASWFRHDITDLIDQRYDEIRGASLYDNVAAVSGHGFETEAELKWPGGFHLLGSYTHSRLRNTATRVQLTNSPTHVGQFRASAPFTARTFLALDFHALSARWTPRGTVVGAYVVPNLTISRAARGRGLGLSFTIANLTNTAYADPVSTDFDQAAVAQDGRTARMRLSWSF